MRPTRRPRFLAEPCALSLGVSTRVDLDPLDHIRPSTRPRAARERPRGTRWPETRCTPATRPRPAAHEPRPPGRPRRSPRRAAPDADSTTRGRRPTRVSDSGSVRSGPLQVPCDSSRSLQRVPEASHHSSARPTRCRSAGSIRRRSPDRRAAASGASLGSPRRSCGSPRCGDAGPDRSREPERSPAAVPQVHARPTDQDRLRPAPADGFERSFRVADETRQGKVGPRGPGRRRGGAAPVPDPQRSAWPWRYQSGDRVAARRSR